jgi:hypothetical protein
MSWEVIGNASCNGEPTERGRRSSYKLIKASTEGGMARINARNSKISDADQAMAGTGFGDGGGGRDDEEYKVSSSGASEKVRGSIDRHFYLFALLPEEERQDEFALVPEEEKLLAASGAPLLPTASSTCPLNRK